MDYSSMKATKTKKNYSGDVSISRSEKKKIKKYSKRLNWLIIVPVFVVSLALGFFGMKLAFKNDMFALNEGKMIDEIMYVGGDSDYTSYIELGAKCVSFGKDCSSDVETTYYYRKDLSEDAKVVKSVDENTPGMYYAVYTTSASRYKTVTLIRNIVVLEVEDNG